MFFRAIALSLGLLIGLGTVIPLMTNYAEASAEKLQKRQKNRKKYKKYSKQWWRAYNRKVKRQRELSALRRTLRLRQIRLANALKNSENRITNQTAIVKSNQKTTAGNAATLPSGNLPKGWKGNAAAPNEMQFNVGEESVSGAVSVVSSIIGGENDNFRNKSVGGVPTSSLRRAVIDQMIREEGWVVNDYQKEMDGRKVYVVVAYSPGADGKTKSRMFYFTEADGHVYRVATSAPEKKLKLLEQESDKIVNSLQNKPGNVQQAELKP